MNTRAAITVFLTAVVLTLAAVGIPYTPKNEPAARAGTVATFPLQSDNKCSTQGEQCATLGKYIQGSMQELQGVQLPVGISQ